MEFRDIERKVSEEYYHFCDVAQEISQTAQINYLKYLICVDKNFFDPYILLSDIYFSQNKIHRGYRVLALGYKRMLKNVFKGELPETMNWYELTNRHLFRLAYNYADILWFMGSKDLATSIFLKLIKMHPSDNIGARYAVVAIQEGFSETNHLFAEIKNTEQWFQKSLSKYTRRKNMKILKQYSYSYQ